MPIDIDAALSTELPDTDASWSEDNVILYHLGLGAGARWTDENELQYTYEGSLKVMPTFAVVPVIGTIRHVFAVKGMNVNPMAIVHGEHEIRVNGAIPRAAAIRTKSRISGVYDRGSGAVIEIENTSLDIASGKTLFTNIWSLFVRGEGGFGGPAGPKTDVSLPSRPPDCKVDVPILPQQAQIYRLSGDKNPYHVDPQTARKAGFDRPIMHGLCSYGMICKAVIDGMLDGAVDRVARYRGRFAKPVFPGETIAVSGWRDDERILIAAETKERGTPVLTHCWLQTHGDMRG